MHFKALTLSAAIWFASATPAVAAVVDVYPTDMNWQNLPGEARLGATAAITDTAPRSGNGSLELIGDRLRFATGEIYPDAATTSIASLADVTALTFDWSIAVDSLSNYSADYTPALRLHIWDAGANNGAGARKELIWEGAYNDTYGNTVKGEWYSTSATDKFYISGGSELAGKSIADWASELAQGSFVAGISVGAGSGVGTGYHAFADNVTLSTTSGSTTYNFELPAAVPEPATWAMLIVGFAMIGAGMRRRTTGVQFA
ncbi:hypothetical protein M2331_001113 [Sphingobium sp. B10D7B]|nr:hypothetical protein [Sphingobium sp. B10D3B]MCW2401203.1 hypothetical protein [Sphingobium sp. B10D7B]